MSPHRKTNDTSGVGGGDGSEIGSLLLNNLLRPVMKTGPVLISDGRALHGKVSNADPQRHHQDPAYDESQHGISGSKLDASIVEVSLQI